MKTQVLDKINNTNFYVSDIHDTKETVYKELETLDYHIDIEVTFVYSHSKTEIIDKYVSQCIIYSKDTQEEVDLEITLDELNKII